MKSTTKPSKTETRGARNLAAPAPSPSKSATWIVRIWYRSQGGELLACDSRPLTRGQADDLAWQMRRNDSDAVDAEVWRVDSRHASDRGRLVVLPSQGPAPERMADTAAPVAAPVDWQLALVAA